MRARGRACDARTVSRPPTPLPSEPMLAFDRARRENVMPGGNGRRVAVVAGCRTPFCRAGSVLKEARAVDLARLAARELVRSEEHTSELQSLAYLVCRLLLEK